MIFKVHQAKSQLSKLIEAALAGEEVVIARGSEPMVKLVPISSESATPARAKRKFGALKGKIKFDDRFFNPLPDDELARWNGEGE